MNINIHSKLRTSLRFYLPYALCNIQNKDRFCFVNRDYCLLSGNQTFELVSNQFEYNMLHINHVLPESGFILSTNQLLSINRLLDYENRNYYFYSDKNTPFSPDATINDVQTYFDVLSEVLKIIN